MYKEMYLCLCKNKVITNIYIYLAIKDHINLKTLTKGLPPGRVESHKCHLHLSSSDTGKELCKYHCFMNLWHVKSKVQIMFKQTTQKRKTLKSGSTVSHANKIEDPSVVAHHQKNVASDSSKEPRILGNLGPVLSRFLRNCGPVIRFLHISTAKSLWTEKMTPPKISTIEKQYNIHRWENVMDKHFLHDISHTVHSWKNVSLHLQSLQSHCGTYIRTYIIYWCRILSHIVLQAQLL